MVLAIALLTAGVTARIMSRGRKRGLKSALKAELRTNVQVTKAIVAYADAQLSGDTSVAPMPRYRVGAFIAFANAGLLDNLSRKISGEIEQIYLSMMGVNKAGRRQEELAFGPAAAFPNAHTLRLENLTYARDQSHNIIEPYQDRLRDIKF